jgi:hypothetical protein
MSTLAAIGRARPSQNVKDVIQTQISMDMNERREALAKSELALDRERLMRMRNVRQHEEQMKAYNEEWLPVDSLMDGIEGGRDSSMAKFLLKKAKSMGFVNENLPGMGGIQRQHAIAMQQVLAQPENVATLSRLRLSHYTNARNQALVALQEKPDDEKLKQAFIQADAQYQAAYKLDPIIQKQAAADQKEKLERDKMAQQAEQKRLDREAQNERARLDRIEATKRAKMKSKGKEKPEGYEEDLAEAYNKLDAGAEIGPIFSDLRKKYSSESKELLSIEKLLKQVADLPEDLQQALEVNAIAINNGEIEADKVITKLGAQWPEHARLIKGILRQRKPEEDLAEALKAIFD